MRSAVVSLLFAALAGPVFAGEVPRPAPDFTVTLPGGRALEIGSLRGKVVLLAFISTTCPHCQQLTGELAAVQRDYGPKGVQIVECAFNDNVTDKMIQDFAAQYHAAFPVGMRDRTSVWNYLQYSVVNQKPLYVPHLIFIDRRGTIVGDYAGESPFLQTPIPNIRTELDKILAAAPAAGHGGAKSKK